jgi:hypothetical protein
MRKQVKADAKATTKVGKFTGAPVETLLTLKAMAMRTVERLDEAMEHEVVPQLAREQNGTIRAIVSIDAELRAQETARIHTARSIPREVVVAYVRELSEEERARFVMEVSAMAEGSVMG